MKRIVILCGFIFAVLSLPGQSLLGDLIASHPVNRSAEVVHRNLNRHFAALEKMQSRSKSNLEFVEKAFHYTHQKMLRTYVPYSQFNELVENGTYDCLSATALFSVIFDRFQIPFEVQETNYHIFITVETSRGTILIETTDRVNGIVTNAVAINQRLEKYRENVLSNLTNNHYQYQSQIFQKVLPTNLIGLLYFNQAVRHYNNQQLLECSQSLDAAIEHYENPRTAELAAIVVHSLPTSSLSDEQKQQLRARYQHYLNKIRPVLASR